MNFTSQICTTKVQSEQLLTMGLKKETADMELHFFKDKVNKIYETACASKGYMEPEMAYLVDCFPAWSLHRLIEMMPSILHDLYEVDFSKRGVFYADFSNGSYNFIQAFAKPDKTLYDNIIDCIEWLIKEGYFNKEYLE